MSNYNFITFYQCVNDKKDTVLFASFLKDECEKYMKKHKDCFGIATVSIYNDEIEEKFQWLKKNEYRDSLYNSFEELTRDIYNFANGGESVDEYEFDFYRDFIQSMLIHSFLNDGDDEDDYKENDGNCVDGECK